MSTQQKGPRSPPSCGAGMSGSFGAIGMAGVIPRSRKGPRGSVAGGTVWLSWELTSDVRRSQASRRVSIPA